MALKTARSSLYFIDPEGSSSGATVVAVGCATSVTGIGASRDQLEDTCLEADARSYEPGLGTPGQAQFTINFDPSDESHVRIYELWRAGTKVDWALGLSDGPAAPAALVPPTLDSSDEFVFPGTRSFVEFNGYVADVPLDLALNALVGANVTIQVSDFPTLHRKSA